MKYRKLRIAWSVAWGVVFVLVLVLWARTRFATDYVTMRLPGHSEFSVMSRSGGLGFIFNPDLEGSRWSFQTQPAREVSFPYRTLLGFVEYLKTPTAYRIRFPDWCFLLLSATFAAAPWLRWRFSLRTLLIVTTLVTVGLGIVVYTLRK